MEEIASRLKSLRMPGMAACWTSWMETRSASDISLQDAMALLLQAEEDARRENRNARLIKEAKFRYQASIEQIACDAAHGLSKTDLMSLATCNFIKQGVPIIITGATGSGKSYLASAIGHQACLMGFKVRYFGMLKLFEEIELARVSATLHRFFDRMSQTDLLIIDDFGLKKLDGQQMLDLMEIMEDRHGRKSTIITSQVPVSDWYDLLEANTTAADAILDRIVHTATRFTLSCDNSRRKK